MIMQAISDPVVRPLHMSGVWNNSLDSHISPPPQTRPQLEEASSQMLALNGSKHELQQERQPSDVLKTLDYEEHASGAYQSQIQSSSRSINENGVDSHNNSTLQMKDGENQQTAANRASTSSPDSDSAAGMPAKKRTASGTVKVQDGSALEHGNQYGTGAQLNSHSRNISTTSTTSSVGDLSLQLKTRLNYAMSKVQRERDGASNAAPIPFLSSETHSPTLPANNSHRRSQSLQTSRNVLTSPIRRPQYLGQEIEHAHIPTTLASTKSAWDASALKPGEADPNSTRQGSRTLAPAPEIVSSRGRRTNGMHKKPSLITASYVPGTPTGNTTNQRPTSPATPTRQEQDAVDTLLFMSGSPAGSANFPRRANATPSVHTSPRRSQAGVSFIHDPIKSPTKQHGSAQQIYAPTSTNSNSDGENVAHNTPRETKRRSTGLLFATEQDVDRILDQIAANRSGDEDDLANFIPIPNGNDALTNDSSINARS